MPTKQNTTGLKTEKPSEIKPIRVDKNEIKDPFADVGDPKSSI